MHACRSTLEDPTSLIAAVRGLYRWVSTGVEPDLRVLSFGDNLLTLAATRTVFGARDIEAPSLLIAAWFGMLVTMLNLMPIGQLDGGHLTHAWFGPRAIPLGKVLAVVMALLAIFYSVGWVVWLGITTRVIGFKHPEVASPHEPLSTSRKWVCAVCFVFFALTLMPVPISAS